MTTATAEKGAAAPSILVQPRAKKYTGMLKTGLVVICGLEKSAKSSIAISAPNSYMLELDAGDADHLEGRIHDIRPELDADGNITKSALNVFRTVYAAALKDPSIDVIGIDTFGTFIDWQAQEIAEQAGLKSIMERKKEVNGYALWDELNTRTEKFVESVKNSGKMVIVNAHCKAPELDEEKKVVIPMGVDTYKGPGAILGRRADLIGYAYKKPVGGVTEYRLTFGGGPLGSWGSRVDALNDKEIRLPKENPWGAIVAAAEGNMTQAPAAAAPEKSTNDDKKSSRRR
jgi:hypothetical protein